MGFTLFLIVFVIEWGLCIFTIKTKSLQLTVKNTIRIVMFIGFITFICLRFLTWSSRYYLFVLFLFINKLIAVLSIRFQFEKKRIYKTSRVIRRTIGITFLVFIVTIPVMLFPEYKPLAVTGKYQVETITDTFMDDNRKETFTDTGEFRKVNVQFWYPKDADGKYPLIVFSHGGISTITSNESLYRELASHGYVVCSIGHPYHSLSTTDRDGNSITINNDYMKELNQENAKLNPQQSFEFYQKWMEIRTGDINFVIDYVLSQTENSATNTVFKKVDPSNIGVMGHSLGGAAALCLGRMREDVKAVIALESPFMCDIKGVKEGEFVFEEEVYPTPVLNVYSDGTWNRLDELPQYEQNHKLLPDTNETAFNVYISGVGHFSLTDLSLTSPLLTRLLNGSHSTKDSTECLGIINQVSLDFFDTYLKGEGEFHSEGTY